MGRTNMLLLSTVYWCLPFQLINLECRKFSFAISSERKHFSWISSLSWNKTVPMVLTALRTSVDFPKNKELDPTRGASKLNQIYHKLRSGLAWILNAGELPKCLSSTFCRPDMVVIRAANDVDRLLPKTGSECAIDEPWAVGESLSSDGGMKTREWSFLCE